MIKARGKKVDIDGELSTVMYEIGLVIQTVHQHVRLDHDESFLDQFEDEMNYVISVAMKELIRED